MQHDDAGFLVGLATVEPAANPLLDGRGVARRHQQLVAPDEGALARAARHVLGRRVTLEQARHRVAAFQVHGYFLCLLGLIDRVGPAGTS